jgi:hypothetical protein
VTATSGTPHPDDSREIGAIVEAATRYFRTFGGGDPQGRAPWNPISAALKDQPPQFAAGVDVRAVVEFVAERLTTPRPAPAAAVQSHTADGGWKAIAESNAEANTQACRTLYATRDHLIAVARGSVCAYCGRSCADSEPGCNQCPPRLDDFTRTAQPDGAT